MPRGAQDGFVEDQENQSPPRQQNVDPVGASPQQAPPPATPQQQHPGSSFKERVQRKMAELERSLRRDAAAQPRMQQEGGVDLHSGSDAAKQLPFLSPVGLDGSEDTTSEPRHTSTRAAAAFEPAQRRAASDGVESTTPWAHQRRLFRDRDGERNDTMRGMPRRGMPQGCHNGKNV